MDIIVHDLSSDITQKLFGIEKNNVKVISDNGKIQSCIGCFDVGSKHQVNAS